MIDVAAVKAKLDQLKAETRQVNSEIDEHVPADLITRKAKLRKATRETQALVNALDEFDTDE